MSLFCLACCSVVALLYCLLLQALSSLHYFNLKISLTNSASHKLKFFLFFFSFFLSFFFSSSPHKGILDGEEIVALKTLRQGCIQEEATALLQEAIIMTQLDHKNVIKLHGVVTVGKPMMFVIEFAQNNSLEHFLRSSGGFVDLTIGAKVRVLCEIADGMGHLEDKGLVHRDLATRNVLLTSEFVCKVCT